MMQPVAHVVFGAGPIGAAIAEQVAARGELVRLVSRSGRHLGIPRAETVAADVEDAAAVRRVAEGAKVAYFACQPAYTNWPGGFPVLAKGVIDGLTGTGTKLVAVDNLYLYGRTGGRPLTEDLPAAATTRKGAARARLAAQFLDAHCAGKVPVVIVRGSNYFGPRGRDSTFGERFFPPLLAGKRVSAFGDPDLPHAVTYVPDFARAAVALAARDDAFGQAWLAPSTSSLSVRQFAGAAARVAGLPQPKVSVMSPLMLRFGGLFMANAREMVEMLYEFAEPFVVDCTKAAGAGLVPTPIDDALGATVNWWRSLSA
jgi:nucleoside-diphosphate-sugar epimerase